MKKNREPIFLHARGIKKMYRVMKLSAVLLLFCLIQVSATVYSQSGTITVKETSISLSDLLWKIQSKTDFIFAFSADKVEPYSELSVDEEGSVEEVLDAILKDTKLDYEIKNGVYVITYKKIEAVEQQPEKKILIKGTVLDEIGEPLPFAAVCFKGTTTGCVSAVDGTYELEAPDEEGLVLEVSSLGFVTQEIPVNGRTSIDIIMVSDMMGLDEVVVTGYQTISKERATGSFEKVDSEALEIRATQNIMDKLEGQTAGVLFDADGNITIRGASSMNASTDPLIVVDGFPLEGSLESINPNDVANMTILKDAAAASIWGARASNGVIVIETKRGQNTGKINVDFSSTLSITQEPDLYSLNRASTASFIEMEEHFANNKWKELASPWAISKPAYNEGLETFLKYNDGQMTEAEKDAVINRLRGIDARNEYADLFLRNAVRQQYHLGINGATEKSNFYASLSYDDDQSYMKGGNNDRIVSNLRIQTKLSDRISFNAAMYATIRNSESNGAGGIGDLATYQQILDEDGNYIPQPWTYSQEGKDAHAAVNNVPYDWTYNMYQEFENKNNATKNIDLRLQAGLNINILKGLDFEGRYQYEWGNAKGQNIYNEDTYRVRNQVNMYAYPEVDPWTGKTTMMYPVPTGEVRADINAYSKSFTTRGQLNFNRDFNDGKHRLYAIAGIELRQTEYESNNMEKWGYDPVSLQYKRMNYDIEYNRAFSYWPSKLSDATSFAFEKDRYASYYANGGYTLDEKYTVTGSIRLDDSNLFGSSKEYRSVPLWSIGANWQLHKESFMNLDFLNRLTFRATYGTGGNIDRTTSPHLIAKIWTDWQTQHQFAYIENPKNPDLRWEKTATTNIGLDYAMFKNRVSGSIEYYNRQSVDLLGNVSINSIYGFDSAKMNFAEMSNKGVDMTLNVGILRNTVQWNAITNFSYNKNNVEKVELADESVSGAINYWGVSSAREGKPLHHIYSYQWAGLSEEGLPQVYNQNGDIIDHNTPVEEVEGLNYEGTTVPRYYGSFQNVVRYKGLQLSMLITYKFGHKFRVPTVSYSDLKYDFTLNAVHSDLEERWRQTGDENSTDVPVLPEDPNVVAGNWRAYTLYGSHNVANAGHIRFNDVVLSYDLPRSWFNSMAIRSLTLGAQVRNLGVITFNDEDIDPENVIGVSGNGKIMPEYTFSLKARF
ncbi:SusC/RagA family TonB-linked outer membrane protein [Carboxylicivirga sp. M1479]|uniref:SusC/RagA family TonB-linked outer membrane protein n=1 Tax=Carboxylicivirga sp. M1479 TaxID=2594476 RepID=UPI0011785CC7|nr:SusC/RagA family TonB-linked outer membrane protein [Carboxylicivirga sp. M1479]TRX71431.1 SusC/RagA family TonB-linked outer membrane protein [Carboxylicivirga sp. M1479]